MFALPADSDVYIRTYLSNCALIFHRAEHSAESLTDSWVEVTKHVDTGEQKSTLCVCPVVCLHVSVSDGTMST